MARVLWAVLCKDTSIDGKSNSISLFNVVEQLNIAPIDVPVGERGMVPIPVCFVILWRRDAYDTPERREGRLRIVSPEGTELVSQAFQMDLGERPRLRNIIHLNGLPLLANQLGDYRFVIEVLDGDRWGVVHEFPLQVGRLAAGEGGDASS